MINFYQLTLPTRYTYNRNFQYYKSKEEIHCLKFSKYKWTNTTIVTNITILNQIIAHRTLYSVSDINSYKQAISHLSDQKCSINSNDKDKNIKTNKNINGSLHLALTMCQPLCFIWLISILTTLLWNTYYYPYFSDRVWCTRRLSNLPKVTQLISE